MFSLPWGWSGGPKDMAPCTVWNRWESVFKNSSKSSIAKSVILTKLVFCVSWQHNNDLCEVLLWDSYAVSYVCGACVMCHLHLSWRFCLHLHCLFFFFSCSRMNCFFWPSGTSWPLSITIPGPDFLNGTVRSKKISQQHCRRGSGWHSYPDTLPRGNSCDHVNHKEYTAPILEACLNFFWRPMAPGASYNSSVFDIYSYTSWDRHGQISTLSFQRDISHHGFQVPAYAVREVAYDLLPWITQLSPEHRALALSSYRSEVEYIFRCRDMLEHTLEQTLEQTQSTQGWWQFLTPGIVSVRNLAPVFQAEVIRTGPLVQLYTTWFCYWLGLCRQIVSTHCCDDVAYAHDKQVWHQNENSWHLGSFGQKTEIHLEVVTTIPPLAHSDSFAVGFFRITGLDGCAVWGSENSSWMQAGCLSSGKDHKLFASARDYFHRQCFFAALFITHCL